MLAILREAGRSSVAEVAVTQSQRAEHLRSVSLLWIRNGPYASSVLCDPNVNVRLAHEVVVTGGTARFSPKYTHLAKSNRMINRRSYVFPLNPMHDDTGNHRAECPRRRERERIRA